MVFTSHATLGRINPNITLKQAYQETGEDYMLISKDPDSGNKKSSNFEKLSSEKPIEGVIRNIERFLETVENIESLEDIDEILINLEKDE